MVVNRSEKNQEGSNNYIAKCSPCDLGCDEKNIARAKSICRQLNPDKPVRVAADWEIWDIRFPQDEAQKIQEKYGVHITILFVRNLVEDSSNRFAEGTCVRTTFLIDIHENCIFETKNTFYILVETGMRRMVTPAQMSTFLF